MEIERGGEKKSWVFYGRRWIFGYMEVSFGGGDMMRDEVG